MSVGVSRIKVPPYFGVPRLSHQFPVLVVVVVTVEVVVMRDVEIEVVGKVTDVVGVVVAVDVEADTAVVVDVLQDANISDVTIRLVIAAQIVALSFMPPIIYRYFWEVRIELIF
jgi:hypothetical protein